MCDNFKSLLVEIFRGDESRGANTAVLPRVLRAEEGLITWATLLAVVLFCALIAMVFNVGRIANDKLEAQNAADSAAYSASLVQARALNAITASNHMMGELTALYTMHHAIGGKVLDDGGRKNNWVVIGMNVFMNIEYYAALLESLPTLIVGGSTPETIGSTDNVPRGEATVYDAKCLLKEMMMEQYAVHMSGSTQIIEGMATAWFFGAGAGLIASGKATQTAANLMMKKIKQEYKFLDMLECMAIAARPIKKTILPGIMTALWTYEKLIAGDLIPMMGANITSMQAAQNAAEENMCVGEVVGRPSLTGGIGAVLGLGSAVLPIKQDPTSNMERTQLMRSTYPWVQEWRSVVLVTFDALAMLSRASRFYEYHSDRYSKEICTEFHKDKGYKLYVMEKTDASRSSTDKGTESWRKRENSGEADELFCLVGFARKQNPPSMTHHSIWPDTNPHPIAAFSQAMIYNGNRPKKWEPNILDLPFWALGRQAQPVEGWDTLGWTEGATEWKQGKPYMEPPSWLPSGFAKLFEDLRFLTGKLFFLDVPFAFPPDIKIPPVPLIDTIAGPPTPRIKLNWQAKLTPVATETLRLRALMVKDSEIRDRMNGLWKVLWIPQLYPEVINH